MKHTEECIAKQEKAKQTQKAWIAKWPNYCKKCNGAGEFHYTENQSPFGSGLNWPMDRAEPCECVEGSICPRCGECSINEDGEGPCTHCGWNYDDMLPPSWPYNDAPCPCELKQLTRFDERDWRY